MKNLLLVIGLFIGLTSASVIAADQNQGGGVCSSQEQALDSVPSTSRDHTTPAARPWVCWSRYAGPVGWGTYYGWAYNAWQARNNAIYYCALQHPDYQFCVITSCYIR